ncbi:hypothetical protein [Plantactinospora mayteni]|nr:hypothetical protein [Plantactinospora mayteni]
MGSTEITDHPSGLDTPPTEPGERLRPIVDARDVRRDVAPAAR